LRINWWDYKNNKNYKIPDKSLIKLKEKIFNRLEDKGSLCLEIIEEYEDSELNLKEFVLSLRFELVCISGEITFTQDEATKILGFDINHKLNYIRKRNSSNRFSLWRLNDMIDRIELIWGEKAKNCDNLIQKYKDLNKDLKEYPHQQHNVGDPHYFKEILPGELDKAYIFGFLGHDGFTSTGYRIGLRINPKDKIIINRLIYLIDLDKSKVKVRLETRSLIYKGESKEYESLKLKFVCKPMYGELENLGDIGSGTEKKKVPPLIKNLVEVAKQKSSDDWMSTLEGRTALAWLLGTYDAEGTYQGHYIGVIYSSQREYLKEIKELFEINTKVSVIEEPGVKIVFGKVCNAKGCYRLSISSKNVMIAMMENYWYSLNRKRPDEYKLSSNGLDNYLGSFNFS